MSDKPIIFSAPMVRALLEGRKTQTRRIIKPQPSKPWGSTALDSSRFWTYESLTGEVIEEWRLPYAPGDRLYVREQCATWTGAIPDVAYRADETEGEWENLKHDAGLGFWKLRPSIHMPRWASRLTLTVTDVRAQRLQEISRGDAMGEGCPFANMADGPSPVEWFRDLWNSLHGPEAWDANPWVAAYSFAVQHGNIDQIGGAQ